MFGKCDYKREDVDERKGYKGGLRRIEGKELDEGGREER